MKSKEKKDNNISRKDFLKTSALLGGTDLLAGTVTSGCSVFERAEKLDLHGFGPDGFSPGQKLNHFDHFYLKMAANIAWYEGDPAII